VLGLLDGADVGVAAGRGVLVGNGVAVGPAGVGEAASPETGCVAVAADVGCGTGVSGGASGAHPATSTARPTRIIDLRNVRLVPLIVFSLPYVVSLRYNEPPTTR
jgi:hypothetical protein